MRRFKPLRMTIPCLFIVLFLICFPYSTYAEITKETTLTVGFGKAAATVKPPVGQPSSPQTLEEGRGAAVVQYVEVMPNRIEKKGKLPQMNEQAFLPIQFIGWTLVGLTGLIMLIGMERGEEI